MKEPGTEISVVKDDYNKVFEKLTEGTAADHALVGYVAYTLYKVSKREWVRGELDKNGCRPFDVEVRSYVASWTDSRLTGLKTEANQILADFASYIVDNERPKIVKDALQERSFIRDAFVACAGAFLYTFLLILFALLLKVVDIDAVHVIEKISGHAT